MVQLARHYGSGPVSLAGIAAEEDLPRAYLEQLVVNLREAGLVVSTRGAHGGYELTRTPSLIPMSAVLRALEGPIAPMFCATDDPEHATTCDRSSRCTVNVLWVRVRDAITATLEFDDPRRPRSTAGGHPRRSARSLDQSVNDQSTAAPEQHLVIRGLRVAPLGHRDHEILQGIDLDVGKGEVHAIMGPNGSGKTTLAYALMGHPAYQVTGGQVLWKGRDILALTPDKRARLGLFLAFQYPTAIPGLSVASFIRSALNAKLQGVDKSADIDPTDPVRGGVSMRDFRAKMREKMALLRMDEGFASRYVNEGFSGGEKKRLEMLQMAVIEPEMAILDETDSGLDIDALRIVAEGVNAMLNPDLGVLLITHYQRLLNYIKPDVVHVLAAGPHRQDRWARIWRFSSRRRATARSFARPASRSNVSDEALQVPKGPDLDLDLARCRPSSPWRPPARRARRWPSRPRRAEANARSTPYALRARLPDPATSRSTGTR